MQGKNTAVICFLISITLLQLMDMLYTLNSWNKGAYFAIIWLGLIVGFVFSSLILISEFNVENRYFKLVFTIFILYETFLIVRGWSFSSTDLTTYLRNTIIFWPFLIPFFAFFDKRLSILSLLFKRFFQIGLVFLFLSITFPSLLLYRVSAESVINAFVPGCGLLLLTSLYFNNKKVLILFIIVFLATLSVIYLGRRSTSSVLLEFIAFSYLLNIRTKSPSFVFKWLPLIMATCVLVILNIPQFSASLTEKMEDRLLEDTRSDLNQNFLKEMRNYMYLGKGLNGTYYYPMTFNDFEDEKDAGVNFVDDVYRNNAENGYLQLLLSGGLLHIILYVMILLPAALLGIFKSSNHLSKACGSLVFLQLINMFVVSMPSLSILYILIWIAVGICYKNSIRNLSDLEIKSALAKATL